MKKIMSMITAMTLAGTLGAANLAVCASAAEITEASTDKTASVEVEYVAAESYTISIPAEKLTLTDAAQQLEVSASDVLLPIQKTLNVAVSGGDKGFEMYTAGDTSNGVGYTVKKSDNSEVENLGNVLSIEAGGDTSGSETLTVTKDEDSTPKYAGTYTGELTFTVSVDQN